MRDFMKYAEFGQKRVAGRKVDIWPHEIHEIAHIGASDSSGPYRAVMLAFYLGVEVGARIITAGRR